MFPSFPAVLTALCEEAVVEVKLICTVRVHGSHVGKECRCCGSGWGFPSLGGRVKVRFSAGHYANTDLFTQKASL